jgi:HSP20 family protein
MSLIKRLLKPPHVFQSLHDPFMMNAFTRDPFFTPFNSNNILTDIFETDQDFKVEADVPGFKKDQISLKAMGSTLYIKGNYEKVDNDSSSVSQERVKASFERVIELPSPIDPAKITATMEEGVLKVTLPKADGSNKGVAIEIQ